MKSVLLILLSYVIVGLSLLLALTVQPSFPVQAVLGGIAAGVVVCVFFWRLWRLSGGKQKRSEYKRKHTLSSDFEEYNATLSEAHSYVLDAFEARPSIDDALKLAGQYATGTVVEVPGVARRERRSM